MSKNKNLEETMGLILSVGTMIAIILVTIGGSIYLLQHGNEPLSMELNKSYHSITFWKSLSNFSSPLGLCELGLLLLVILQSIRVFLLGISYFYTKDYLFTLIAAFVLTVLIVSFIWI